MKRFAIGCLCLLLFLAVPARPAEKAPPARAAVVDGNTQFALELYAKLKGKEGNLFFSPFSISTALAMTSAGADGETLAQMRKTLHLIDQDKLHPSVADLLREINGAGVDPKKLGYQLNTANALWGQKGYAFSPEFLNLLNKSYGAGMHQVDFVGETEKARQTINAWVEKQTRDKIKELLKKGALDTNTRLVLTNAIYFKGDWASQFKKDRTREDTFHVSAKEKVQVPLMNQTGKFAFADRGSLQVLEMPYVGKDLSMVVLLPKERDGLATLEKSLTSANLAGWLKGLHEQKVAVTLPKFRMTDEFRLKKQLAEMGMPLAFTPGADFSRITGDRNSLHISDVVHKAFIAVDEQGTEAAAATAVIIKTASPPQPVFRADHPFVFLIRDKRSGSVLFCGRVVNPK